ncbi:MAG TPA: protein phosphatase 2C domain-containing protein [Planctomycetota bacterium]|nr:protein phosphatase 2C domain-containing protein [Planctomycetota bacterium]
MRPTQLEILTGTTVTNSCSPEGGERCEAPVRAQSFGMTHRGRVRPTNEDHFLVATLLRELTIDQSSLDIDKPCKEAVGRIFVVADGVGGGKAGERASSLAVTCMEEFLCSSIRTRQSLAGMEDGDGVLADIEAAVRRADARILEESARDPALRGMATTLTIACGIRSDLFVIHVGDSRCYLFRGRKLEQLTRDQTLVEMLHRQGSLKEAEKRKHPLRNILLNSVGGSDPCNEVQLHRLDLEPGDRVLLASDGLTDMVNDDAICAILAAEPHPRDACERLVAAANENGGKDNITVIVSRYEAA